MLTLIKNGEIYAPEYIGKKSILIAGREIMKIGDVDEISLGMAGIELEVIDAEGALITPGFIDPHVHFIGGGGEGGFATRTPEIQLSDMISGGITTAVGVLGTDGTTRHMTSLLAKAFALEEEGITTFIYTGNYHVPTPTITSTVKDDIILINKILGAGEIAISDSRSAQPTIDELAKLVAEARIGGLLSGKAGVTHFHVGPGKGYLSPLHKLLKDYEIPPSNIYATHITRSRELMDDAIALSNDGAFVDITADDSTGKWISYFKENGGCMGQLTISSDGNGSLPKFDKDGDLIGFGVASTQTLYRQFVSSILEYGMKVEEVLPLITTNTSRVLHLPQKGSIQVKADADILILDRETLGIRDVFAKGQRMIADTQLEVVGAFETLEK
ncbi:beta-aspartyl-peptidase [Virgibacillus sediminis]|uniref:Isoaspartyl dipeptidase n=1 Tax=Virgibacillus sediminis TaxID=202260 RepID=A0ABV7A8H2_9BACI